MLNLNLIKICFNTISLSLKYPKPCFKNFIVNSLIMGVYDVILLPSQLFKNFILIFSAWDLVIIDLVIRINFISIVFMFKT